MAWAAVGAQLYFEDGHNSACGRRDPDSAELRVTISCCSQEDIRSYCHRIICAQDLQFGDGRLHDGEEEVYSNRSGA